MKRILAILLIALIVGIVLVGCQPAVTPAPTPVLTIDTPSMGLVGYQLTAKLDGSAVSAVYSSTDTNVSVTAGGLVTPLTGTGTALVTATYQGVTATYNVPLQAIGLVGTWLRTATLQLTFAVTGGSLNSGTITELSGPTLAITYAGTWTWTVKDGILQGSTPLPDNATDGNYLFLTTFTNTQPLQLAYSTDSSGLTRLNSLTKQ